MLQAGLRTMLALILALVVSIFTGCTNQDLGTVTGGALGGLLGSQVGGGSGRIVAAVGGTLLGAYLGNRIGGNMDEVDKLKMERAMNRDKPSNWQRHGRRYSVRPGRRVGHRCRRYTTVVTMENGKAETVHGTACLRDGRWVNQ